MIQMEGCALRNENLRKKQGSETRYDAVVVGGGMAGLTASAFLAQSEHSVLLCDQASQLGGLVQSFERDGFVWDAGIRAIEDSGIIFPMLGALGINVEFLKSPVSLGIEDHVIPVESRENLEDYQALLEQFYPECREDVRRIVHVIRRVMKQMDVLYGIENPLFKDLAHDRTYVLRELLPWLGKFLVTIGRINRMNQPVDEYLETLTGSRSLIDIISQHFFRKTPTFFALSYFSLYLDYVYPAGGTAALPHAMESYCIERGVDIRTETKIVQVDPAMHSVTAADGARFTYRKLIWCADLKQLYNSVCVDGLSQHVQQKIQERSALVNASSGGDSVFTLYLPVTMKPQWFAERSNGHFFYTPSRRGVGADLYAILDELLRSGSETEGSSLRTKALAWARQYAKSTTYEISIPVLKDPSLAPAGSTGLIVSVLLDYGLCAAARNHGWYEDLKGILQEALIETLEETVYPGICAEIRDPFSSTPLTIEAAAGSSEGAITGWAFTNPVMPAVHRMQHSARAVLTPIPDVLQAGQWSFSPSGLPIAILTGKLAADRVARGLRWMRKGRRGTRS